MGMYHTNVRQLIGCSGSGLRGGTLGGGFEDLGDFGGGVGAGMILNAAGGNRVIRPLF